MFGRIRAWSRRHSTLADVLWLAPLIGLCVVNASTYAALTGLAVHFGLFGYVIISAALLVPLFWRNTYPRLVFAAISLISFGQWVVGGDPFVANFAVLIALFAVASHGALPWAVAAGAVAELGIFLALVRWNNATLGMFFSGTFFVVTVWVTGIYAKTRRRYLEGLEERAERAERERDQQAKMAAAAERTRIARELHDVVAHNVSVIIVQADGAGYAIDSDPEQARLAVQAISKTGREALAEMRRLVGVLRQDGGSPADYLPQPGLEQLAGMVRGSGLPVALTIKGTPPELPEGEQLVIYRIVQEALTNALKHGGPEVTAVVEIDYGPQQVSVRIADDGRGAAVVRGPDGHGLVGMRERVGMYGGAVWTGPRAGGGFEVRATLPVPEVRAA
ncbi:sensor histidine kinase [Nonomuraea sp. NPDC046570]|uniref:sensor histidine kinase n=1 Tax=Nonomuraea sp. NPDC046570 TaxID=3155255 RepID=UPI0033CD034C